MNIKAAAIGLTIVLAGCSGKGSEASRELNFDTTLADNPHICADISNGKVNCILEDSRGYIWIGTFRGLNRYNGYEYRQYFFTGREDGLPDNQVRCLYEDAGGRVWVGTVAGVCTYEGNDVFRRIPMKTSGPLVSQIFADAEGRIYANAASGICRYSEEKGFFEEIVPADETDTNVAFNRMAYISGENELWTVSAACIRRRSLTTMQVRDSVFIPYFPNYVNFDSVSERIHLSYTGMNMAFNTRNGRFMDLPKALSTPEMKDAVVRNILRTKGGQYLINTDNHGLFVYDPAQGQVIPQGEGHFPFRAPDFQVGVLYEDSRENIWMGFIDQGVEVVSKKEGRFSNAHLSSLVGRRSVTSLACDSRNNLYMATLNDGLMVYGLDSGIMVNVDRDIPRSDPGKFRSDINCLYVDAEDHLWVGTKYGVSTYEFSGERLRPLGFYSVVFPMGICEMPDGDIYVSSAANYVVRIHGPQLSEIRPFNRPGLSFIPCVEPDEDRILVGAFANNLSWIDSSSGKCSEADIKQAEWKECLRTSTFIPTHMHRDAMGQYWIGTVANGLLKYVPSKRSISRVAGLPCSDISAIQEDRQGMLWVSTMYGMCCLNPETGTVTSYYAENGIGGNQFYDRSTCRLPDGRIAFGGTHGVTIFNPATISGGERLAFYFEDLKIDNGIVRPSRKGPIQRTLAESQEIVLKKRDNSFAITFAALEYGDGHSVHYSYRMTGYDRDWIESGIRREAFYHRLPAGKYTFEVKTGEQLNSIVVRVKRPVLLSWWAMGMYLLMILGIVVYVWHTIYNRKKNREALAAAQREKEHERKVNQMNMSFFANVSHEFRTPLTMIAGPVGQLQESPGMSERDRSLLTIVQRNVRRMLRLVNQMLDLGKLESDMLKLKVSQVDVTAQMSYLADILRVSSEEKNIRFITRGLETPLLVWADIDKVDKICWNLLSNAFKFTPPGGKIEFFMDLVTKDGGEWLNISVTDSGPGIPEEDMPRIFERYFQLENGYGAYNYGSGIGLYFAKALVEMHHGTIGLENVAEGTGAHFHFSIPVHEAAYSEAEKKKDSSQGGAPSFVRLSHVPDNVKNPAGGVKRTILVVDDDMDVAYYLRELLSEDFNVVSRFDADSAYDAMREESPEIVLSDVVMNGKSGFDLCRRIKDDVEMSHIPVILLTAKASVENQIEGLNVGADAYVSKPFDPQYLKALIFTTLRNRDKIRKILNQSTKADNLAEDAISPADKAFMNAFYELMEKELSNPEIDVQSISEMLRMSRTKFYYKVKGLTGENPATFFKAYKLNRAAQLILEGTHTLSEIADMTGFSTPAHFSTSFKKRFGVAPSQYRK